MKTYNKGDVILFKHTHPSHSWNNGLFIVLKQQEETLRICKLDEEGIPQTFEDGRFMQTITSPKNPFITKTKLSYKLPTRVITG